MPLFPLPGVTLFPGVLLPLRVFEPRYLAMMEHAMALPSPVIAMVNSEAEGPGALPMSGVGRVLRYEPRGDGTYGLLLEGQARVRLEELPQAHPFRLASASVCYDEATATTPSVEALKAVMRTFVAIVTKENPELSPKVDLDIEPGALADLIMSRFTFDSAARQRALETLDVEARLGQAMESLLQLVDTISERAVH